MGIFYTNIALFKVERNRVLDFLQKEKRTAFVSPRLRDFIVVYDKETEDQDTKILFGLAEKLSKILSCNTFVSLVHDGDVFYYWLYEKGVLVDQYNSMPDYFDGDVKKPALPVGGNAERLCAAFEISDSLPQINQVFETAKNSVLGDFSDDSLIGEEIHFEFVKHLKMPSFAVEVGYYTIDNGYLPTEFEISSFTKVENN